MSGELNPDYVEDRTDYAPAFLVPPVPVQVVARVDAIVDQVAYAQAHGCRAVLDEAIRNGGHLKESVQADLVKAREFASKAEAILRTIAVTE